MILLQIIRNLYPVRVKELKKGTKFYFKNGDKREYVVKEKEEDNIKIRENNSENLLNFDKEINVYCNFKSLPKKEKGKVVVEASFSILFLILIILSLFFVL